MLFLLHNSFILDSSTRFIHHEIEIWTIIQQLQKLLEILFISFKTKKTKKTGFRLQMYILCKIIPQKPPNAILTDRLGHIETVNTLLKKLKEQRVSISVI